MTAIDFSEEEHVAMMVAVRRTIDDDRFPLSPHLAPFKSALAKLDRNHPHDTASIRAERYREKAAELRLLAAEKLDGSMIKDRLLGTATGYETLATQIENWAGAA